MRGATILGLTLAFGMVSLVNAEELKVGDKAPEFSLKGSDGKTYKLSQFKGKQGVVIAWFPKAFTGGCTAECKSFRAHSSALKDTNVAYFTASCDTPEDNAKFAESLGLDYPILSDPTRETAKAFGVVTSDTGNAKRWTFYIDKDGVVKEIDKMIKTANAGEDVVSKIKSLGIASK